MSWYELFLFVHVITAVIWVGGGFVVQVLAILVRRSGDPVRVTSGSSSCCSSSPCS